MPTVVDESEEQLNSDANFPFEMYDFNYIDKGNNWPELYPKCGGLR